MYGLLPACAQAAWNDPWPASTGIGCVYRVQLFTINRKPRTPDLTAPTSRHINQSNTSGKPRLTHVANSLSGIDATGPGRVEVSNKT